MKAKKTDPMKRFLKQYPFLAESERIHRLVGEAVGTPEPIQLPERAVTKTLAEKLPILQQETYRRRMVRAVYMMRCSPASPRRRFRRSCRNRRASTSPC